MKTRRTLLTIAFVAVAGLAFGGYVLVLENGRRIAVDPLGRDDQIFYGETEARSGFRASCWKGSRRRRRPPMPLGVRERGARGRSGRPESARRRRFPGGQQYRNSRASRGARARVSGASEAGRSPRRKASSSRRRMRPGLRAGRPRRVYYRWAVSPRHRVAGGARISRTRASCTSSKALGNNEDIDFDEVSHPLAPRRAGERVIGRSWPRAEGTLRAHRARFAPRSAMKVTLYQPGSST
jgi:hypothetical protein